MTMIEKEYIERKVLQNKAFGEEHPTFYDGQDIADWYEKCINETAAADVAPVRHGRWIEQEQCEESLYSCSACGTEWATIVGTPKENGMNFCPRCGAKMDEEESEKNA